MRGNGSYNAFFGFISAQGLAASAVLLSGSRPATQESRGCEAMTSATRNAYLHQM